jgi:dTDP-glucose pyrophosphorylase
MRDIASHLIRVNTTLRDAIQALNSLKAPAIYLVVVDESNRVQGTVTDGDIRRAVLRNLAMDAPIVDCMHRGAILGHVNRPQENEALARGLLAKPRFLPVVDDHNVLVTILNADTAHEQRAVAMVMAGGRGNRLGELTLTTPKPLIEVGGKPILEHVLDRLEAAGIDKIFISTHYLAEQIEAYTGQRKGTADIELIHEDEPLGTAGSISKIAHRLDRPLLLLNGDIITHVDLSSMLTFHEKKDHSATLAVKRYDVDIPFGVIRHTDDGRFLGIDEKPRLSHFVSAGLYLINPEVGALVPQGQRIDMPEVINLARDAGLQVGLFPIHEYWIDVGRPQDLATAQKDRGAVDGENV